MIKMRNETNKEEQEIDYRKAMWGALAFIVMVGGTLLAYYFQEKRANEEINSCTIITVAYPKRWVSKATLYYYFYIKGKKLEDGETMRHLTMGKFERGRHLMKDRFWVRVYCKDLQVNRIYWDAKVPDTLQYIPKEGWKEIPYGLAEEE